MSYLALARKWRPRKFSEVIGQSHVLTALENALEQNRLHHAYLLSGTRGVGKTSIGRLFAKGLNCETGITSSPCGVCSTCIEIDEGRSVDLLEIDAASRTKVEDTRELLDNVQYKPARNRFKVYLIDEVHMLSRHSFNALLKTLEEPPEYVKFLLATTDPQKLPMTILSRCLQFHLKPITVDDIQKQLAHILKQEQVDAEAKSLPLLAYAADGSMRDALSLTDQAIALGNGAISADSVSRMLGVLDTAHAIHILEAIASYQGEVLIQAIEQLAVNGVDWDSLLQELATQLHRIAMYQALPASLDKDSSDANKIEQLAGLISPQDVQLYYQIALKGRQDLPSSPTERIAVEMTLLRMLAFKPAATLSANEIVVAPSVPQPNHEATAPQASFQPQATPRESDRAQGDSSLGSHTPPPHYVATEQYAQTEPVSQQRDYEEYAVQPMTEMPPGVSPHREKTATDKPEVKAEMPSPAAPVARGLRHQLRSQRQGLSEQKKDPSNFAKKTKATSESSSVLERVAQRKSLTPPSSDVAMSAKRHSEVKDEPYRWQPINEPVVEKKSELTPTQIKSALEHVKTPEMAELLLEEAVAKDEWSALVETLATAKMVEQLALNAAYSKDGSTIALQLRSSHAHLNTERNQAQLLDALNRELQTECHLSVQIGEEGVTPLELREQLYQQKLQQAFSSLEEDRNIQFLATRFSAELDESSVRPL
ncbi:DNA polymerase III subunit gamma/tau [Vibrio sp. ZSDZ34]|uniref:DNA polymerase III subunit gamma/tau n=1 Tax=Vibrio gelatinilyticus TaxID=2893468 RepID=A0A9X2AUU6_9VIBR|nr:DNA polymerase III subunit gamma/tau [Vibrio gelatinilyticus]MCJ2375476.1 DNA polymerase III subunit gamma/tau [Vibrio gelatinilyticus]